MKITLIHGQSHKGSTYHVARILAEKIDGEITETSYRATLIRCVSVVPSASKRTKNCVRIMRKLAPITEAIDAADL